MTDPPRPDPPRPGLRLVPAQDEIRPGLFLRFHAAGPPTPEVVVVEDDTCLVLGADPAFRDPGEHPVRVLTAALEQEPTSVPTLLRRGGRCHIVVHDLDASPTTDAETVQAAWSLLLEHLAAEQVSAARVSLLGCRTGALTPEESLGALLAAHEDRKPPFLDLSLRLLANPGETARGEAFLVSARRAAGGEAP